MTLLMREDVAKAAKLGAAIVATFGLAAYRVVAAVGEPPSRKAVPQQVSPVVSPPVVESPASGGKVEVKTNSPTPGFDPFRPLFTAAPMAPPSLVGKIEPALQSPAVPLAAQPLRSVEAPLAEAASAPLRLTGVVAGPNASAVLQRGEEETVVHVGTRLPDGALVVRIDRTTLTLRQNAKTTVLSVGD